MLPIILKAYPVLVLSIILLDFVWLGVIMKDFYRANIGHLMGPSVVWGAAAIFYLIYAAGLLYFAVLPGVSASSWVKAAVLGALVGALCYATYDLSNHATLKDWPLAVTILDIIWGTVLSASVAVVGYLVATTLFIK